MNEVPSRLDEVDARLRDLTLRIETLNATKDMIVWIFSVVSIVLSLILGVGALDYLKNRSDLRKAISAADEAASRASKARDEADAVRRNYAEATQGELIDVIEAALTEQSLDSLRTNPSQVAKIKGRGAKLREVTARVDRADQTTFLFVLDALDSYLTEDYEATLTRLDKVTDRDRQRLIHAQMRGICLLRLDRRAEAAREFNRAAGLAGDRRQSISLNLKGLAHLYEWRASREAGKLQDAVSTFEQVIRQDPTFPTAYLNLALSVAQLGPDHYARVTEFLVLPDRKNIRTLRNIAALVVEDLNRPSDRFLTTYVSQYLQVREPYTVEAIAATLERASTRTPTVGTPPRAR